MYIMAEAVDTKMQDFGKLIRDMVVDLTNTFLSFDNLDGDLKAIKEQPTDSVDVQASVGRVREYRQGVLPPHFFDVLYQNADIFNAESEANTTFLPGIDFKVLWAENISDQTRETIWKYLQLATLSVATGLTDQHSVIQQSYSKPLVKMSLSLSWKRRLPISIPCSKKRQVRTARALIENLQCRLRFARSASYP